MLNRRILRSKALQCLYAFYKSKEANYNLAIDYIRDRFLPDLNSMEPIDKSELNLKKRDSIKTFEQNFKHDSFIKLEDSEEDIEVAAHDAFIDYEKQNEEDYKRYRKNMLLDVERIFELYLWILMIPEELIRIMENDPSGKLSIKNKRFIENPIITLLRNNNIFQKGIIDYKLSWIKEKDLVYNWFKNSVSRDEDYESYINGKKEKKDNFTTDKKLILHLYKNLLFKNDAFQEFMASDDLNWNEDRHVIRSMIVKTFKNLEAEDTNIELAVLSNNWEEDRSFFEKLFEISVNKDKEFDKLIAEKSKNWDIERMAIMDKIILKMAIGEMIYFPNIPVKVTINEYIELSKNFSTPKSKKFVNGILDVLSEELIEQGIVKKSGRGLIDNK
ncbi:MAG: transcription antitermination factor NusB [Cyclobacteriaceae bacterium]